MIKHSLINNLSGNIRKKQKKKSKERVHWAIFLQNAYRQWDPMVFGGFGYLFITYVHIILVHRNI